MSFGSDIAGGVAAEAGCGLMVIVALSAIVGVIIGAASMWIVS